MSEFKIKGVCLTNNHHSAIINGKPNDPPEKRPFLNCATPKENFNSWLNNGFVPFTCNVLKHKNVHHMLSDGGASDEMMKTLNYTKSTYKALKQWISFICIDYFIVVKLMQLFLKSILM